MQIVIISSKNGSIPPISAPYSAETKNPATTFKNHLEHTITHPNRQKNSMNPQNPEQRINKTAYPDTFSCVAHERKRIPKKYFDVLHLHTVPIKQKHQPAFQLNYCHSYRWYYFGDRHNPTYFSPVFGGNEKFGDNIYGPIKTTHEVPESSQKVRESPNAVAAISKNDVSGHFQPYFWRTTTNSEKTFSSRWSTYFSH